MADSVFLPGNILSLAAGAADRLIAAGNGDAALLSLWLLTAGGAYQAGPAAHALRWDPARTEAALSLLVEMGLAEAAPQAPAPALQPSEEPPEYTAADLNREL